MGDRTNARAELINHVGARRVAYGRVRCESYYASPTYDVRFGSHGEYLEALPRLDFTYHAGFGGQEHYGTVVFEDGTWLERSEYDGSEWWEHKSLPTRDEVLGTSADA